VSKAGAVVAFSHRHSGIDIVASGAPDFLDRALAGNKFTDAAVLLAPPPHEPIIRLVSSTHIKEKRNG
jgi:hypothetical protein